MADSATVGFLKAMLTMDTASFDAGSKKASQATDALKSKLGGLSDEVRKLTPLAERMVKGFGGDKLLYTANSLTAAVTKLGGASKLTEQEQARVNKTLNDAITKYQKLGQTAPKAMVDLEVATRRTSKETDFLTAKMAGLGAAAGVFATQLAGDLFRGMVRWGKEAIDTAGNLSDLSQRTGLTTTTLQRMDAVAGQTGGTLEGLTNVAFRLGDRLSGGGDSVRAAVVKLGLDFEKLRTLSLDQQFETIIIALGKMQNATERNDAAVELFGLKLAQTALAAAKDYKAIADAAKISSEEQIQALDVLGDRFDQLQRDAKTAFRNIIAEAAFAADELKNGDLKTVLGALVVSTLAGGNSPGSFITALGVRGERNAETVARLKKIAEESAAAQQTTTKAVVDYVAVLRDAQNELGKLDAAERKQILAAQQSGAEQDVLNELVIKYGVSAKNAELVLKLLNEQMKQNDQSSKALAKTTRELAEAAARSAEAWFDVQVQMDRAMLARQRSPLAIGDLGASSPQQLIDGLRTQLEAINQLSPLTIFGDLVPQAESAQELIDQIGRDLEDLEAPARRTRQMMTDIFAPLLHGAATDIGRMIFGGGDNEAEKHYKRLRASGTATAEELSRAYRAWRNEERNAWENFTNAVKRMLNDILSYFVNAFMGGLIKSVLSTSLGKIGGGFLSNLLGFGGGVGGGAATTGGVLASSSVPTSLAMSAVPGGTATGTSLAAASPYLGLWSTAGIMAPFAAGIYLLQKYDRVNPELAAYIRQRTANRANDPNYDWRKLPNEFRGWRPPSTSMPSVSGIGGFSPASNDALAHPMSGPPPQTNVNINIRAWDSVDVRRQMPRIIDELKFEAVHNQRGLVPALAKPLGLT